MALNRFFFLHIPKTAGSSLHRVLAQMAGPYMHLRYPHEFRWTAPRIWSRFRGCGGHINWAGARQMGYLDGFTIAFLRDPARRVLSQYAFSRQASDEGSAESLLAHSHDLHELLRASSGHFGPFWNMQTSALSGLPRTESDPEKHLASALENLERLNFLGTAETFQEDVHDLAYALGCSAPPPVPKENITRAPILPADLPPNVLGLLEETQSLDRALYRRAVELRGTRRVDPLDRNCPSPAGWPPTRLEWGNRAAQVTHVSLHALNEGQLRSGQLAEIDVEYQSGTTQENVSIGFSINDLVGNHIGGSNSLVLTGRCLRLQRGEGRVCFRFPLSMGPGSYALSVAIHRDYEDLCWIESAINFEVYPAPRPFREGMVNIDARFLFRAEATDLPLSEENAKKIHLEVRSHLVEFVLPSSIFVPVRLVNRGDVVLHTAGESPIAASYHWIDAHSGQGLHDGIRTPLPREIWPGEEAEFTIAVEPPPYFGRWRLQIRVLQEGVRWHEGPGFEGCVPTEILVDHLDGATRQVFPPDH